MRIKAWPKPKLCDVYTNISYSLSAVNFDVPSLFSFYHLNWQVKCYLWNSGSKEAAFEYSICRYTEITWQNGGRCKHSHVPANYTKNYNIVESCEHLCEHKSILPYPWDTLRPKHIANMIFGRSKKWPQGIICFELCQFAVKYNYSIHQNDKANAWEI